MGHEAKVGHVRSSLPSEEAQVHRQQTPEPSPGMLRAAVSALVGTQVDDIAVDDDLIELGLDSLGAMKLVALLNRHGVRVKFSELVERRTLATWWELIAPRVKAREENAPASPAAVELDETAPFDLAVMQHAYWVGRCEGQVLNVGSHYYFEFDGHDHDHDHDIDAQRLELAVRALVRRHGMLRARFLSDGRQQIRAGEGQVSFICHDLRGQSQQEVEARLAQIRECGSNRKLDIDRGEGLEVQLSLLPGRATRTHINIDMLVADALSFRVLIDDLAQLYLQPGLELAPIEYSFPRYLAGKSALRDEQRWRAAKDYWAARLYDLPAGPDLPLATEPERIDTARVSRRAQWLSPAEVAVLSTRAQAHGVTLSMVFANAFAQCLAAWSTEPRFILNLPLFDREPLHPDVSLLVGDFTSLLLLEVDMRAGSNFAARARQLQSQFQVSAAQSEYTGTEVLRDLARVRGSEQVRAPVVFTSALGMGELFSARSRECFGKLTWMISQTSQVWLDYQVTEHEGGVLLNWDAVEQLYPAELLDAMFEAHSRLLAWLGSPDGDWQSQPPTLLPAAQIHKRLEVNATQRQRRRQLLHQSFFAHAQCDPERTALLWGEDGRLSYGALAERARCIAARLVSAGVCPGDRVAVTLPKGPAQIEAVLGVLCVGATYVPVSVEQPAPRRALIHKNAEARVALTTAPLIDAITWPEGVEPLELPADLDTASGADSPASLAPVELTDAAVAYIIFTSGSTGEPKGVMVSHAAAMNTVEDLNQRFGVGAEDRALAVSALDFDLSVYDIFGLLSAGGAIVTIRDQDTRDAQTWVDLVRRHHVTIWQSAPALLDMLLVAGEQTSLGASLRLSLLGGDWVGLDLCQRLAAQVPGCRLIALGGTTETAIHSTIQHVDTIPSHWRSVPYGTPLGNVKCRVVDACGRDCPDWVRGELWIGGASVAEGYCNDPARTAERFVTYEAERWYRTGDLARYWPDGTLEFLGRADHQIKIRGHRIELAEVESALEADPRVSRAVCAVIEEPTRQLAVAVLSPRGVLDAESVRRWVAERLPSYMVPERVLVLPALPLSRNGKIDRKAVASLLAAGTSAKQSEPPHGPVECLVAAVWAELLAVRHAIGRDQSFFALGGDSLIATKLLGRLRGLGVQNAELKQLFSNPVLKDFAAGLELGVSTLEAPPLAADPEQRYETFPLTEVQQAYLRGRDEQYKLGGVGSHWYWEFDGAGVDLARLEAAVRVLVERHEMMRAVVEDNGQRILATVPPFELRIRDASASSDSEALRAFRESMSHRLFDTAVWPLFDVQAMRYGEGRVRIGFGFDYIVLDALSITILFSELSQLYAEPEAELPPLSLSFRDYVLGVKPDSVELASARDYWCMRLPELPPAPELPLRQDPARVKSPRFTRREDKLSSQTWDTLKQRARRYDLTPSTVLATAFAEVLSAWSSRPDLTINLTLFDRQDVHPDAYHVVGDFTSLMLVPYVPDAGACWLAGAKSFQDQVVAGLEHRSFSAVSVLRELARAQGAGQVDMPVVFTSTLGVADQRVSLTTPFGVYAGGLSQTPQVWLDNQVLEYRGELHFNWDAVEDLFEPGVLDAMFAAYRNVLDWLAQPDADWSGVIPDLLPPRQRSVRAARNATGAQLSEALLHTAFFEHARAQPERDALVWGDDERLSYGELADRALRVAAFLVRSGVRPGAAVAITLPKGADQIIATLGVLAAGAVYVPVGIEQPPARRDEIYSRARVAHVITQLGPCLSTSPLADVVECQPDSTAYVIFTSGSTGRPKGVQISHRAVVNTIEDINARYSLGSRDRTLAISALDFDLSVFDVFGPLSLGGAAVLIAEDERREARRWVQLIRRWGVTVWNTVPALLDMLLLACDRGELGDSLRLALVSGDWIGLDLPRRLRDQAANARFIALGGATEAAIWSNAIEVSEVPAHWRSIPYGFPLRNQKYRVVDARGRDCPDHVAGELWIGGAGVAQGYCGDPETSARHFVEHDGERWYRTGDLGRYWDDGTLEFLGRTDHQIKLRGHRIELGEIEAALSTHPRVVEAVVVLSGGRQPKLCACIKHSEPAPDPTALRAWAAQRLPPYMVPDEVLVQQSLPLTANGKLDRAALRRMAMALNEAAAVEAPVGPTEELLMHMWRSVLGVTKVSRRDNFFVLGGDSLLATQLAERLRREHGVDITLRQLFASPTIADLAALVAEQHEDPADLDEGQL